VVGQEGYEVVLSALTYIGTEDGVQLLHGDGWVEVINKVGAGPAMLEQLRWDLGIKS